MTLYVMDTDHTSLVERGHLPIRRRILAARRNSDEISTTVVTLEEQFAGRLAQIHRAQTPELLSVAYRRLKGTFELFADLDVLDYGTVAGAHFQSLRRAGLRIGTHDLRIASIVLANEGIVLTRNQRDFEKVPGLAIQDWALED